MKITILVKMSFCRLQRLRQRFHNGFQAVSCSDGRIDCAKIEDGNAHIYKYMSHLYIYMYGAEEERSYPLYGTWEV